MPLDLAYIKKHCRLFLSFIKLNFKKFNEYKVEYYISQAGFIFHTILTIFFWNIIILHTGPIGGWDIYSLTLLTVYGRFQGTFFYGIFGGIKRISRYIVDGDLVQYMIKPNNILLRIIFKDLHVLGILDLVAALVLTFAVIFIYGKFAFWNFLLSFFILIVGNLIVQIIFGCVSTLAFWFGRVDLIVDRMDAIFKFSRYPITIFPRPLQLFFSIIIPLIFIRTYPVMAYTGKFSIDLAKIIGLEIVLLIFWSTLFLFLWKKGLKHYEAFGG